MKHQHQCKANQKACHHSSRGHEHCNRNHFHVEQHEQSCETAQHGHSRSKFHAHSHNGAHACSSHTHHHGFLGEWSEILFVIACGICLAIGWIFQAAEGQSNSSLPWSRFFFVASYFFGSYFTVVETLQLLGRNRFSIEALMLIAAIGAACLGEWREGALLLFLFSLGHALEHYALDRARKEIQSLANLTPKEANVYRDGITVLVPIDDLKIGDVVLVKPNEKIPVDGRVVGGFSEVNQSSITGESLAVSKFAAVETKDVDHGNLARDHVVTDIDQDASGPQTVFAGTINGFGALDIEVTKLSTDSTVSRIVQLVQSAESQRSPSQRFADRFERIFVPIVLLFAASIILYGALFTNVANEWIYKSLSVLVAASPCALAIATPCAVLSAIATAARKGVLIKGGGPLEELGKVTGIALDKTGTLTVGKPMLVDVTTFHGVDEKEVLTLCAGLESMSDHPIAKAILRGAQERIPGMQLPIVSNVKNEVGQGIQGTIQGLRCLAGNPAFVFNDLSKAQIDLLEPEVKALQNSGRTVVLLRREDKVIGLLGLTDTLKPNAILAINELKTLGIQRIVVLSGDHQKTVDAIAKDLPIDLAQGNLLPKDKLDAVANLGKLGGVAMVGDGVNDAPALAIADVGIAMGAAGSELALETADIALMNDELLNLSFAVGLSRKTSSIIKQNLLFSLGMVAILIPATLLGLHMGAAVLFHEGSTLLVVLNGLRLLTFKPNESLSQA